MTNPGLVKKYFLGKAEVGDSSKDLVVEPRYSLVFNGRLPYQKETTPRLVAWRPEPGLKYLVYGNNCVSRQVQDLVKKHAPVDSYIVSELSRVYIILNSLSQFIVQKDMAEDERVRLIKGINANLATIDIAALDAKIDKHKYEYERLWTTDCNLEGIDESLAVLLVTRRLMS